MPLITITRSVGCGGTTIARLVADELGLELYDDRRLEAEATRMGLDLEGVGSLDEKAPSILEQLLNHRPQVYLDLVQAVVFEVARRGHGVILGHGSPMLLSDFGCGLHVRVDASREFRIHHLMETHGLAREVAEKRIHKADHEQRGFLRFAFHMDWTDPSLYDIVVNRDKLSEGLVASLIAAVAGSHEIRECSAGALETMERMSLCRRVEAAVLEAGFDPRDVHVEVPEKNAVRLIGIVHDDGARERLVRLVGDLPGVLKVEDQVTVVRVIVD